MNVKYCYREPNFPESAYLALVFLGSSDGFQMFHPMLSLYPTLSVMKIGISNFDKDISSDEKDPTKVYGAIVIKINLNKKFPLKKELWTCSGNVHIDAKFRIKEFIKMTKGVFQFYNIIVLPNFYDKKTKQWSFQNWIPILSTYDDQKIYDLLKMSDQGVEVSAKSIGLYSIEFIKGFDLDTGKFIEPKNKVQDKEYNC